MVLLHDHLDGGLRPQTVLELADIHGYTALPHRDPGELASWFDQSESGSLESYLSSFEHTIGVMQHPDALERIAYESCLDLAKDGVVYAESRFCPALHARSGMTPGEVIEAVAAGMERGAAETGLRWGLIIDALRHLDSSLEMARAAISARSLGVVGFDLAGPEAGFPPEAHVEAFRLAKEAGLGLTIHAGEAAGEDAVPYLRSAVEICGADRIGHGLEITRDCVITDGEIEEVGPVARMLRDHNTPLEMCPSSNLATNRLRPAEHPIGMLYRGGFNITINTDNRLMSSTRMSEEFRLVRDFHGFGVEDLAITTRRSLEAAFCDEEVKAELWEGEIAPEYSEAGATVESEWTS